MLVVPKMKVHARSEDRKDKDLQIFKGICVIGKQQWREDIYGRENESACIVKHVVLHQDGVQAIFVHPPALYDTYECEGDQSQLRYKKENI